MRIIFSIPSREVMCYYIRQFFYKSLYACYKVNVFASYIRNLADSKKPDNLVRVKYKIIK